MRLKAAPRVLARRLGEVKSISNFNDESRQVVLRESVVYRQGQQIVGFVVGGNKVGQDQHYLSG